MGSEKSKPSQERVIRKPPPQPSSPTAATAQAGPSTTTQAARNPAKSPLTAERNRSPYNYTQSQLKQAAGSPQPLYPNLNTLQQEYPNNARLSTSDFVSVNRSGNAERRVPMPSAPPAPRECSTSSSTTASTAQAGPSTTPQAAMNPVKISPITRVPMQPAPPAPRDLPSPSSPAAATAQAGPSKTTQAVRNPATIHVSPLTRVPMQPAPPAPRDLPFPSFPAAAADQVGPSTTTQAARNLVTISPLTRVPMTSTPLAPRDLSSSSSPAAATAQAGPSTATQAARNPAISPLTRVPMLSAPPAPRDRSSSRLRSIKGIDLKKMKCSTCKKTFGLSIFQCSSGHSSCSDCKKVYLVCGKCYNPIGDMRNIMLEELVSEMKVKCPNSEDGCILFMKMANMEKHALRCPFRDLPCPLSLTTGCVWKGKLSHVAGHFDVIHPMNCQGAVDTEMSLNLQNNCQIPHLVVIGNFNFIFHLMVNQTTGNIYVAVQLIGTGMGASKWTYDIQVYNKGEPHRKFQFKDVCTASNTNIWDLISTSKCAVLPISYAKTFLCNNKLNYKYYIKKEA